MLEGAAGRTVELESREARLITANPITLTSRSLVNLHLVFFNFFNVIHSCIPWQVSKDLWRHALLRRTVDL